MLEFLQSFQFLRPWWLALLLLLPVIVLLHRRRLRGRNEWKRVIDASLLEALVEKGETRPAKLALTSFLVALLLATLAMAGPAWKALPKPVYERIDALVIALDLSASMQIRDISPNRLDVAKRKIIDLLRSRTEGRTALIVYAGDAHIVTPLSEDSDTLLNLLEPLEPALMPIPGSRPGDAIQLANELLANVNAPVGRILLITDGVERLTGIARNATLKYRLSILGVGTPEGGPIPVVRRDGSITHLERNGRIVNVPVDVERLKQAASMVSGRFSMSTLDDSDLNYVLGSISGFEASQLTERNFDVLQDAGHWLLLPLLALAALALRRGVVVVMAIAIAPIADASWFDDLWQRQDQQGYRALKNGEPEEASQLFSSMDWQAVSNYRSGEFEQAEEQFSQLGTTTGTYNAGNALARQGKYAEAIDAYDRVLAELPEHADARHNRDLLASLLEQQQQFGPTQQQQGQQPQHRESQSPQRGEAQAGPQPDGSQSSQDGASSGERPLEQMGVEEFGDAYDDEVNSETEVPSASEDDSSANEHDSVETQSEILERQEAEEALQRWMRSLPNDRNMLLYNKFRMESQRRIDSGEYRPSENENPW